MCTVNPTSEFIAITKYCKNHGVKPREKTLWLALFYIALDRSELDPVTQVYQWPDTLFPIATSELESYTALDRRTLLEARAALQALGVLDVTPGLKNIRMPLYRLRYLTVDGKPENPFSPGGAQLIHKAVDNSVDNLVHTEACSPSPSPADAPVDKAEDNFAPVCVNNPADDFPRKPAPRFPPSPENSSRSVPEEKEPRGYEDGWSVGRDADAAAHQRLTAHFAEIYGHPPTKPEADRLMAQWANFGADAELVESALDLAARSNAHSPTAYTARLLDTWWRSGIRSRPELMRLRVLEDMIAGRIDSFGATREELLEELAAFRAELAARCEGEAVP